MKTPKRPRQDDGLGASASAGGVEVTPSGLANHGNSCFFNSALQLLLLRESPLISFPDKTSFPRRTLVSKASANTSAPTSPIAGFLSKYSVVSVQCFSRSALPSAAAPRGPTLLLPTPVASAPGARAKSQTASNPRDCYPAKCGPLSD